MRRALRRVPFVTFGLLVCLMTIILAGCESGSTQPQPTALPDSQQVLRAPLLGQKDISGLDPATVADATGLAVMSLIYPGLVTLSASQLLIPWAADWLPDVSEDGLTYAFH